MYSEKILLKEIKESAICIYGLTPKGADILKTCKYLGLEDVYFVISDDKSIADRFVDEVMVLHIAETRVMEKQCIFILSLNKKYHNEVVQNIRKIHENTIILSETEWETLIGGIKGG